MTYPYHLNKVHVYNWRKNNPDQLRLINRNANRKYDAWKKIKKIYLNILL